MKKKLVAMLISLGFSLSLFSAEIRVVDQDGRQFSSEAYLELNLFKKRKTEVLKVKALVKNLEVQEFRSNGLGYEGTTGCMGDISPSDSLFYKPEGYELTREEIDNYCDMHICLLPRTKDLTWVITHQGEIKQKVALEFQVIEVLAGDHERYEKLKTAEQTHHEIDKDFIEYLESNLINQKLKSLQVGLGKVVFWAFQTEKQGPFILKNGKVLDI